MKFVFESELASNPVPHNQSRYNRYGIVYKSKREKAYITELEYRLTNFIHSKRGFETISGVPIRVDYLFGFVPPKSWSKKKRLQALNCEIYPTSQQIGDWDNLCKSTQDRLNALIIEDDRYIVDGHGRKIYTEKPYLRIEIEEA